MPTGRAICQQCGGTPRAKCWPLDIDGSVLTTGLLLERAERGFNPHHRKGSAKFLRETLCTAREELGLKGCFEVRVDSAFFQREFLAACDRSGVEYAVKVPMWPLAEFKGNCETQEGTRLAVG